MKQFLIAIDQLFNSVLGGYADETLSARAWRMQEYSYWSAVRKSIDSIFFWEKDHCKESYLNEIRRKQLPSDYK